MYALRSMIGAGGRIVNAMVRSCVRQTKPLKAKSYGTLKNIGPRQTEAASTKEAIRYKLLAR